MMHGHTYIKMIKILFATAQNSVPRATETCGPLHIPQYITHQLLLLSQQRVLCYPG